VHSATAATKAPIPAAVSWKRCLIVGISAETLPPAMSTALCVSAIVAIAAALPSAGTVVALMFILERVGMALAVSMLANCPSGLMEH